jgi:hypothetical protein
MHYIPHTYTPKLGSTHISLCFWVSNAAGLTKRQDPNGQAQYRHQQQKQQQMQQQRAITGLRGVAPIIIPTEDYMWIAVRRGSWSVD